MTRTTFFPDHRYAHCLECGLAEGQGLVTDGVHSFVRCWCGAEGGKVLRADFVIDGHLDVAAYDNAARRAWNVRDGSDGVPEILDQIKDINLTIKSFADDGKLLPKSLLKETEYWVGLYKLVTA